LSALYDRGFVRLRKPGEAGAVVGAGLLVDAAHVITCAHVVNQALNLGETRQEPPEVAIAVDFPRSGVRHEPIAASVVTDRWRPVAEDDTGDLAVLKLSEPVPEGCLPPPLCSPHEMEGHGYKVFGYPRGNDNGATSYGKLGDKAGPALEWVQIEGDTPTGQRVEKGFSGAPVWDQDTEAVVGIVVAADRSAVAKVAFMIPLTVLLDLWAPLQDATGWRLRFDSQSDLHWRPSSRGIESVAKEGSLFTGRTEVLRDLALWLANPDKRERIVIGRRGSGKSAVLARLVALADPEERPGVVLGGAAEDTLPPLRSIRVAINARGRSVDDVVAAIAKWTDADGRSAADLRASLSSHVGARPPVVLIDALDEAKDPLALAHTVVEPLAQAGAARFVIGVLSNSDRGVLESLRRVGVERDLDSEYLEERDLEEYVRRTLEESGPKAYEDHPAVAERVARAVARRAQPSFLVGRLVAHSLCLETTVQDPPPDEFPDSVAGAMARYLAQLAETSAASSGKPRDEVDNTLRDLMSALAHGHGLGLPAHGPHWPAVARAVSYRDDYTERDSRWVFDTARAYLKESRGTGDVPRVQLSHQALVDYLRNDEEGVEARIACALLDLAEDEEPASSYTVRHLSTHVARAGPAVWELLAQRPDVLDRLDPTAVAADAQSAAFDELPEAIIAVIATQHLMVESGEADRGGLRELGVAWTSGRRDFPGAAAGTSSWAVNSAVLEQHPVHITIGLGTSVQGLAWVEGSEGPLIAAACADETLRLVNTATGEPFGQPLAGHVGRVLAVASFPGSDGRPCLVSGGADGTVRIWDPATGRPTGDFDACAGGAVLAIGAYSADGERRIVTGGEDEAVRIWDTRGREIAQLPGHRGAVRAIGVCGAANGSWHYVVTGSDDECVRLWELDPRGAPVLDPATGGPEPTLLHEHSDWIRALCAYESDGALVVGAAGDDEKIVVWPEPGAEPIVRETGHIAPVFAVAAFEFDGERGIATASGDATVRLWPAGGGAQAGPALTAHRQPVRAATAYPVPGGSFRVATGGDDGTVRLWNPVVVGRGADSNAVHSGRVQAIVEFELPGKNRRVVATGGDDGMIHLWDASTGDVVDDGPIDAGVGRIRTMALTGDGARVVVGGDAEVVRVTDLATGEPGDAVVGHIRPVRSVVECEIDGHAALASGGEDGIVLVWDPAEPSAAARILCEYDGPVRGIAAYGNCLAVVGPDRHVRLREAATTSADLEPLVGLTDWGMCTCAYEAGANGAYRIVAGADDGSMRIWDPDCNDRAGTPVVGHRGSVRAVIPWSGDGTLRLISGSHDGTVRLWDALSGEALHTIQLGLAVNALCAVERGVLVGTAEGHLVLDIV
jgi:WD40 repeat protein